MNEKVVSLVSAAAVFVAGLFAFSAVTRAESESTTLSSPGAVVSYSNLDPEVESALVASGAAWVARVGELAGVPSSVARVLDTFQTPLMIPVEGAAP